MPAGRGNICEQCYWDKLLHQKILLNSTMLEGSYLQQYWFDFGFWLNRKRGSGPASTLVNRYILFFYEIASKWKKLPDYKELLNEFGVAKLRKFQNVIRWLEYANKIEVHEQLKLDTAEQKRIQTHLDRVAHQPTHSHWIKAYHQHLVMKYPPNKINLRSIRLALCPASYFLIDSSPIPTQLELEHYLHKHRGQYSAISGFITFINKSFQLSLTLPSLSQRKIRPRTKLLEKKLINIYLQKEHTKNDEKKWIKCGLEYFHSVPTATCSKIKQNQITISSDSSYTVLINKTDYWLPPINRPKSHNL